MVISTLKKIKSPPVLLLFILAVFLIASPNYSHLVDDDWAYIISVQNFMQGKFAVSDYVTASTVLQTWLGYLYSSIVGFSISNLHLLAGSFSVLSVFGVYFFIKKIYKKDNIYLPLILFLNPVFFFLSYSFGTDVLFTALVVWSVLFYKLGLDKDNLKYIVWGSAIAGASILLRQIGFLIPIAVVCYLITNQQLTTKKLLSVFVLPIVGVGLYLCWFHFIQPPTLIQQFQTSFIRINLEDIVSRGFQTFITLGLFALPASIFTICKNKSYWVKVVIGVTVAGTFALYQWFQIGKLMVYNATVFTVNGFAPNIIKGTKDFLYPHPLQLGIILTILSVVGAGLLLPNLIKKSTSRLELLCAAALIGFFFFTSIFYSRYYLPPLALILCGVFYNIDLKGNLRKVLAGAIVSLLLTMNLIFILEYKSWNNARWSLGQKLLSSGVSIQDIDGGYEWNSWYLSEVNKNLVAKTKEEYAYLPKDPRYIITFTSPLTGLNKIIDLQSYQIPYINKGGTVYVVDVKERME